MSKEDPELQLEECRAALRAMALELSREADIERTRIARGLHDDLGQTLVILKLRLAELANDEPDPGRRKTFTEVVELLEEAVQSSRSLTFSLAAPLVPGIGIEFEIEQVMLRLTKLGGLRGQFASDAAQKPLSSEVAECVLRVVNELLLNVVKHSEAEDVGVEVTRVGDQIQVVVVDDGVGFEPQPISTPERVGLGLLIMCERLAEVGGNAAVESSPGVGTRVVIRAPLSDTQ